jgi:hypothetical protein
MKVIVGGYNNVFTAVFDESEKTLAISGVSGFDLTEDSLDNIWDTTASKEIPCKRVTMALTFVAGLPVYTYTFFSLPSGLADSDTLVITLNIPDAYATVPCLLYTASKQV